MATRSDLLPAVQLETDPFEPWFARVESYVNALGCRAQLIHIGAQDWERLFDEGMTAEDAVLFRLSGVAD